MRVPEITLHDEITLKSRRSGDTVAASGGHHKCHGCARSHRTIGGLWPQSRRIRWRRAIVVHGTQTRLHAPGASERIARSVVNSDPGIEARLIGHKREKQVGDTGIDTER